MKILSILMYKAKNLKKIGRKLRCLEKLRKNALFRQKKTENGTFYSNDIPQAKRSSRSRRTDPRQVGSLYYSRNLMATPFMVCSLPFGVPGAPIDEIV